MEFDAGRVEKGRPDVRDNFRQTMMLLGPDKAAGKGGGLDFLTAYRENVPRRA